MEVGRFPHRTVCSWTGVSLTLDDSCSGEVGSKEMACIRRPTSDSPMHLDRSRANGGSDIYEL